MASYEQPDELVEAVLADEVYHSPGDPVNPPDSNNWAFITCYYDSHTGYYGEAWGKITKDAVGGSIPGQYSEIIQVNRGTVFSSAGTDTYLASIGMPTDTLATNSSGDRLETVGADAEILVDIHPAYFDSANMFYRNVIRKEFPSTPVVEVGQSLGGATSNDVVAENAGDVVSGGVGVLSSATFNALPLSNAVPKGLSDSNVAAVNLAATNYDVANEVATQGFLANTFIFSHPIGHPVLLPSTPVNYPRDTPANIIKIHNPDSAVAQLYRKLYQDSDAVARTAAAQALLREYSDPLTLPVTINAALANSSPPSDGGAQYIVENLNRTVTLLEGGTGDPLTATFITSEPTSGISPTDTLSVKTIAPYDGAIKASESDLIDAGGNVISFDRTQVFGDGSFNVYNYDSSSTLQSIYTAQSAGDQLLQTYANGIDLRTSTDLNTSNVLDVKQYEGDPTLISDSTIDLGGATVTSITENPDQSVLAELNYGATATDPGSYLGLLVNPDGTSAIVDGQGESGTAGAIVDFASGGLNGAKVSVSDQDQTETVNIYVPSGGTVEISSEYNLPGTAVNIVFEGKTGLLKLDDFSFSATLYNARQGNQVEFVGVHGATILQTQEGSLIKGNVVDPTHPTFILQNDRTKQLAYLTYNLSPGQRILGSEGYGASDKSLLFDVVPTAGTTTSPPCFASGTRIDTEGGPVPVEALTVGTGVLTRTGETRPIRWIGHRAVDCRRHREPENVWPVRVIAGAFGGGMPCRDLFLSPDHAVFVEGALIPVHRLINGATIVREPREQVTYWHVELDRHDLILAEGLACESYLDAGNRGDFDNGGTSVRRSPELALKAWEAGVCAPLVLDGPQLEAARRLVLAQAARLGHAMTQEPDLQLVIEGRVLRPEIDGRTRRFRLPVGARRGRLVSRSSIPAEVKADTTDRRRLGIAVSALACGGEIIPLTDPGIGTGWHEVEQGDRGAAWRWTDGAAEITLGDRCGDTVEVEVASTGLYWLAADATICRPSCDTRGESFQ